MSSIYELQKILNLVDDKIMQGRGGQTGTEIQEISPIVIPF